MRTFSFRNNKIFSKLNFHFHIHVNIHTYVTIDLIDPSNCSSVLSWVWTLFGSFDLCFGVIIWTCKVHFHISSSNLISNFKKKTFHLTLHIQFLLNSNSYSVFFSLLCFKITHKFNFKFFESKIMKFFKVYKFIKLNLYFVK